MSEFPWDFDSLYPPPDNLWLLKWEATNIYRYIFDTDDISCIRGGSQLLENFTEEIRRLVARLGASAPKVTPVYNAASQFLALAEGNREDVAGFGDQIVRRFASDDYCGTSGYGLVNPARIRGGSHTDHLLLQAIHQCEEQIVRKRLSSLDVYPGGTTAGTALDEVDRLHLADGPTKSSFYRDGIETHLMVSQPTKVKVECGKSDRWGLIEDILPLVFRTPEDVHEPFYQDLSYLAADAAIKKGYVAFLAVDGNAFTASREQLTTLKALGEFSTFISNIQLKALAEAVRPDLKKFAATPPGAEKRAAQPIQLLFRAGDEFDLVVRGERGVDVAISLMDGFEKTVKDELREGSYPFLKGNPDLACLSFSVGLVFAHASTPVKLLREAAHELLGSAKSKAKSVGEQGVYPFMVDFMTFESHPTTSDGIEGYRKKVLRIPGSERFLHARPYTRDEFRDLLRVIRLCRAARFPTTQLHKIVSMVDECKEVTGYPADFRKQFEKMVDRIELKCDPVPASEIKTYLKGEWDSSIKVIDVYELYDYVAG